MMVAFKGKTYSPSLTYPDPAFVSSEIGSASGDIGTTPAHTVIVAFSQKMTSNNFKAGVTIKVNGVSAAISTATLQLNRSTVYYRLTPGVVAADVVTWEYASAGGLTRSIYGNPLPDISAQAVTNDIVP